MKFNSVLGIAVLLGAKGRDRAPLHRDKSFC
jgi:hypothetical protein